MKKKFLLLLCLLMGTSQIQCGKGGAVPILAATYVIGEKITVGLVMKFVAVAGIFTFAWWRSGGGDDDGGSGGSGSTKSDKKLTKKEILDHMNAIEAERLRRSSGQGPDDDDDQDKYTTPVITRFANYLGFNKVNGNYPHGEAHYRRGNMEISHDNTNHNGGFWKAFDRRGERTGTFDIFLRKKLGK